MIYVIEKAHHRIHIIDERELERLQFQGDLQPEVAGGLAQLADVADAGLPLLRRRDDLPLPNVFAEHQQQIASLELVTHIEIAAAAFQVEALHARVEVDQSDGHAGDADDGQSDPFALAADQPAFAGVDVERVGENVDGVEADLFRHLNAERRVAAGLRPCGVDKAEFHEAETPFRTKTGRAGRPPS